MRLLDILNANREGYSLSDRAKAIIFSTGLLTAALLAEIIDNL